MDISRDKADRKFLPAMALDTGDFTMLVADALKADFGGGRNAVKRIAAAANSNFRTAKNWYTGANAPGGLHLVRLMAHSPTLAAECRRLSTMQAEHNPDFERALQIAMAAFMRLPKAEQDAAMARMAAAEGGSQ